MKYLLPLLVSAIMLPGCNSDDEPEVLRIGQDALDFNQTKWANANLNAYRFTVDVTCFCVPEEDIVFNVNNDAVTSAFFTPSGVPLNNDRLAHARTIDDYFGLIQEGIDEEFAVLEAEYDPDYGFPTRIYVDRASGIADDEVDYRISDLQ